MNCPNCDEKAKVLDTAVFDGVVYRKRKCQWCGLKFFTIEDMIDYNDPFMIKAFKEKRRRYAKN